MGNNIQFNTKEQTGNNNANVNGNQKVESKIINIWKYRIEGGIVGTILGTLIVEIIIRLIFK